MKLRLGVDLGGTKIEGVVLADGAETIARLRLATPAGDYSATVATITELVQRLESEVGVSTIPTGICTPGAINPATGLLKNANSTCLNGMPLQQDLEAALQRKLRLANDADCLAISEATDGAAAGASGVFAVIIGTGVGGGFCHNGHLLRGVNAIAGEWGHNPLPWPEPSELPGQTCWCGRKGCLETWISGPAMAADYRRAGGEILDAVAIVERAQQHEKLAVACLQTYKHRLARGLASVINVLDPEVIVLGGGLSQIQSLYTDVPKLWGRFVFSDAVVTRLAAAQHGDASGVRGAAWLWPKSSGGDSDNIRSG